ncbi:MAG TPA: uroporphyrinogen decarboxylase family protein [Bryobacteraceae bacterium]
MTGRERILAMMDGRLPDRLGLMPITMMFAARQIGACYRAYATDFRVLAEAQVRTAETFGFDYVSAISDPAREAADLGAAVEWFDDQPPAIIESRALIAEKAALAKLRAPDPLGGGRMHDRVQGVALLRERAGKDLLVEGWVEGPCAMAADLRGINTLMLDFYDDPDFVRDLFEFSIGMELEFARAQVQAGADLIGVGDAAASLVGPALYNEFVWPYERKLMDGLHALGTRIRLHICGNTRRILGGMGRLEADIVDLDWMAPLGDARRAMGAAQVLAGNLDPVAVIRNGTPEAVTAAVAACHAAAGPGYIVAAGCEVVRDTPVENLRALCDYARSHGPEQTG